jgi:hypothetical protein
MVMDRLDRENANSDDGSPPLSTPTEKLRARVERQVRDVVEETLAQAVAIDDCALAKPNRFEEEAKMRATEALDSSIERSEGILGAVDSLHREMAKVIEAFHRELDGLTRDLKAAHKGPAALPEELEPTGQRAAFCAESSHGPGEQRAEVVRHSRSGIASFSSVQGSLWITPDEDG